ncbi:pancreatic triacylglycerol lipase-like [Copidosoma floridanum]|uniref:pancreatic triacylglycerol lipase-like n=1 Tax=Copidosoma floridanum TaxID=29053 RepID=UPI0006C9C624|nr:pancreatic triacylglycerol lipase-like [Copidosoma floridanum]
MSSVFYKNVEEKVSFHLFTKENMDGEEIVLNDVSIKSSSFNFSRPTKIITHGYWNQKESNACTMPRDAFLKTRDCNVLVVDWWKMESISGVPIIYNAACKSVPIVAEYVATMIDFLESHGLNLNDTSLIGHSLGAHLMGIAASKTKNRISHIVGLDPAGPIFQDNNSSERLSPDDATTVLVIHTNVGHCGLSQTIGHYDFYPNGGHKQPGCWMNHCAHSRSYELYAESIFSRDGFYANWCSSLNFDVEGNCNNNTVKMDENLRTQNAKEGIYYLETSDSFPYALGR